MNINVNANFDDFVKVFENNLKAADFIVFDFATKYQINNVRIGKNKYLLNYSRSIPTNITDALTDTFNYSYFYYIEQQEEIIKIKGKIWPKKLVIFSLLLFTVLFIFLYKNDDSTDSSPGILIFIISFILLLLTIEYFIFKRKVKDFFYQLLKEV